MVEGVHSQAKGIVEESKPSKIDCCAILVEESTKVQSKSVDNEAAGDRVW
jgi:hypothetical protein